MIESSLYDHLKIRSAFTEHPIQNNKDLTPGWGGSLTPTKGSQGHWLFQYLLVLLLNI